MKKPWLGLFLFGVLTCIGAPSFGVTDPWHDCGWGSGGVVHAAEEQWGGGCTNTTVLGGTNTAYLGFCQNDTRPGMLWKHDLVCGFSTGCRAKGKFACPQPGGGFLSKDFDLQCDNGANGEVPEAAVERDGAYCYWSSGMSSVAVCRPDGTVGYLTYWQ